MTSRWKRLAKSILSYSIVRKVTFLTNLRFSNGRLNVAVVSLVITKNLLVALFSLYSVVASNRAIKRYRDSLKHLTNCDASGEVKLLHLIYGLKQSEPIYYFHWALLEKMINTIKPHRVIFHYTYEPEGAYWELIKSKVSTVKVPAFEYYGIAHLKHYAHKADVIRLLALYEMGGLYLDIDTLVFESFDSLFERGKLILGVERMRGSTEPCGLCNAVVLAPRSHEGVRAWLQSYLYFRGKPKRHWEEHSVRLPFNLLRRRGDVSVLDSHSFFEINWDEANLFFDRDQAAVVETRVAGAYSQHLWETKCMASLLDEFKTPSPGNLSFLGAQLRRVSCKQGA